MPPYLRAIPLPLTVILSPQAKDLGSQRPRLPMSRDPSFVRMTLGWVWHPRHASRDRSRPLTQRGFNLFPPTMQITPHHPPLHLHLRWHLSRTDFHGIRT